MDIRKLVQKDLKQYKALRLSALEDVPILFIESKAEFEAKSEEKIASEFLGDNRFFFGAFNDQANLVAMVGFRREISPRLDHIGFIWGLYVAPVARGNELGRSLIQAALEEARSMAGVRQVKIQLEAGNDRAKELYESLGFVVWGTEPAAVQVDGTYYDDLHMILSDLHGE